MAKSAWLGVDIGGTKTRVALCDNNLKVLEDIKFKTPKNRQEFESELTQATRRAMKVADAEGLDISGAGVGAAGAVDRKKLILTSAPNLPFLEGFSLGKMFHRLCHCHVALLNDLHAALYGELKVGKAAGYKDVIAIFIGTGIGGAVAINGKLHLGVSERAGDIGHYLLHAFGPLAGSERHGILDDFASRLAIAGTAATFVAKNWAPHLLKTAGTDVRKITSSALAESIRNGDDAIEELVRSRIRIVGIVLSNVVDFLSPELIVLGGGLTDELPKLVRQEVTAGIEAHGNTDAVRGLKVVTTEHKGHAVTIGAACFARDSAAKLPKQGDRLRAA